MPDDSGAIHGDPAWLRSEEGLKAFGTFMVRLRAPAVALGHEGYAETAADIAATVLARQDIGLPTEPERRAAARGGEPIDPDRIVQWVERKLEAAVETYAAGGERALNWQADTDRIDLGNRKAAAMPDGAVPPATPAASPAAPPPDPRRLLTEALAVEGVRLGKPPREAVVLARQTVAGMDDDAVQHQLASLRDRKWALREDGTLAPDVAPVASPDPLLSVLANMKGEVAGFAARDPRLAQVVGILAERAVLPGSLAHAGLRTRIAYAAQDVEKAIGRPLPMPGPVREEIAALAATAPGLEHGRMKALLAETPNIPDPGLVAQIRRTAADLAKAGDDQHGEHAQERVEALERRLRIQGPPPATAPEAPPDPVRPAVEAASPGPGPQVAPPEAAPPAPQPPATRRPDERPPSVSSGLLGAMRQAPQVGPPPWQTVTPGLGARVGAFETRMQDGRTARLMGEAERLGDAALRVVERFAAGQGKPLLGRIEAAAGTGGVAAVLAEMRPGGAQEALRTEFGRALTDPRFTQAYREVRTALEGYGQARLVAGEDVRARGLPAERLAGLERVDAALGDQAARIPGEKPGTDLLSDLGAKVAEVLREAAQKVAAALAAATVGARAAVSGASPSPTP